MIGKKFHSETSMSKATLMKDAFTNKPERPEMFKGYPDAETIELPEPDFKGAVFESVLSKRRSIRSFSDKPLLEKQLSQLLYSAQGITDEKMCLRTSPSGGALYPFEIYVFLHNVEGLDEGLYHYDVQRHRLDVVEKDNFKADMTEALFKQEFAVNGGVTFVLSAVFDRSRFRYGERAFRYIYMEAGHISQNIYLQATSMGLGSVAIAAFDDDKLNRIIQADGEKEAAVYVHAVGHINLNSL